MGFFAIAEQLYIHVDALPRLTLKFWLVTSNLEKKNPRSLEVGIDTRYVTEGTTQCLKPCVLGSHVHTELKKLLIAEGAIINSS